MSVLSSVLLLVLASVLPLGRAVADDAMPAIAVASSLRAVWPTLAEAWRADLPDLTVRASFGASNTLARQIRRGAPFELFLSADDAAVATLPDAMTAHQSPVRYASGRLAVVLRESSPDESRTGSARVDPLATLAARLDAEPMLRLALPNPVHAPYGRAAREALEHAGLWPLPDNRLIRGENAAQALQFLLSGAVGAALLPYSLVVDVGEDLDVSVIDANLHAPLSHPLIVLPNASPAAHGLAAWMRSRRARDILAAAGFDIPS